MTPETIKKTVMALTMGQVWTFGYFWAKRKRRDLFCLFDSRDKSHSRWGNLDEICGDIEHVVTYNHLPREW